MEKDYGVGLGLYGVFAKRLSTMPKKHKILFIIWRYLLWQAVLVRTYLAQKKRKN